MTWAPETGTAGDGRPVGDVAVRHGPGAAGGVRGGRDAAAGRFARGGVRVLPGGDGGVRGVVASGSGVVHRRGFGSGSFRGHGHGPGAAHRPVAPACDLGVSSGGDGGDLVGSGAYRRHRDPRHPGGGGVTGGPTDLHRRAAVRYGADGVDIDEIDAAAMSVRTSISAGPVASLPDLADAVRRNVIAAIGDHTQLHVDAVDIDIDDLEVPPR